MTDHVELGPTTPVLRIFDLAKAREFYLDFLGFVVDWEHRFGDHFPVYMRVSRGDCVLHLSEHHGDATPGSRVLIETKNVEALHEELDSREYRYLNPQIEDAEWGSSILALVDPFGNHLLFSEPREPAR